VQTVLVTGLIATQNSPFLYQGWPKPSPVLVAPTSEGDGQAGWPGKYWDGRPAVGGHQSQY